MHTKQSLLADLKSLGIDPTGTLMVHVSYKSIGEVEGRADAVLDALSAYMQDGLLVLPSHTWDTVNAENPVMDVRSTETCVGILTELFRKRPNVRRSLHPTHSLAALGEGAEAFIQGEELARTPCPENGAYYKLFLRDAQILLIGVDCTRNTYIHGIEEWEHVPGTISEAVTPLCVIGPDGVKYDTPQNRHCAPLGSEPFWKVEGPALREGVMTMGRFGDAEARVLSAAGLRRVAARMLAIDNTILMNEDPLDGRF